MMIKIYEGLTEIHSDFLLASIRASRYALEGRAAYVDVFLQDDTVTLRGITEAECKEYAHLFLGAADFFKAKEVGLTTTTSP